MRLPLLALMLGCGADAGASVLLEIDGACRGAFQAMEHPRDAGVAVTLTNGWIARDVFESWGVRDAKLLEPGSHSLGPESCQGLRLTISQVLGEGLRQSARSWTLLDACPAAWSIETGNDDTNRLRLESLTLKVGQVAVVR
ncbi:MAG: hypothetical protein ACREVN_10285 [Gammaproteobacteria bacterium]